MISGKLITFQYKLIEFYFVDYRLLHSRYISESDKRLIYFIGLVDILTYYGVKKKTASAAKAVKYGLDADNISTVKPYQVKIYDFLGIRNVRSCMITRKNVLAVFVLHVF